ncbi:MAG: protease HtpX [Spirochaetia bacterium]|nr:protease HtpX [Spirochaetia bacterium]
MAFVKRIFLFMMVNLLVVVTISIVTQLVFRGSPPAGLSGLFVMCLIWGMAGSFISLLLSKFLAKMMYGVQVIPPDTTDPHARDLVMRVHQLARAAGLDSMPDVGIYDSPEVNAFATGPTKNSALVAVSTGLLGNMGRDEVDGVLGHEISHIANGDMVTMTLIQGVINAIVMFLARVIAFFAANAVREEARWIVRFLVTIVLEIALSLLGMIVVNWFSRQREFRADAGGARLAGRDKMIRALQALKQTRDIHDSHEAQSIQTLKISGKAGGLMALLSTHPDLDERIRRLQFGGV